MKWKQGLPVCRTASRPVCLEQSQGAEQEEVRSRVAGEEGPDLSDGITLAGVLKTVCRESEAGARETSVRTLL